MKKRLRKTVSGFKSQFSGSCRLLPVACCLLAAFPACNSDYTVKPPAYPRIDFPPHSYALFDTSFCPCTFEYPTYGNVRQQEFFFDGKPEHPCWLNVNVPRFNATIHLSYKDLRERYSLARLLEDAHRLTYKHSQRADYIDPVRIETPNRVHGLIYNVGGDAASSFQFFLTDTVSHFLRGSLYIRSEPNIDSLRPVIDFLVEDAMHLIETLKWKEH
jgi:gliding motility-associated lipoprotein GldD